MQGSPFFTILRGRLTHTHALQFKRGFSPSSALKGIHFFTKKTIHIFISEVRAPRFWVIALTWVRPSNLESQRLYTGQHKGHSKLGVEHYYRKFSSLQRFLRISSVPLCQHSTLMVTASWMPCLHRMMKVHWTQYELLFPKLNNCWSITRSHHKHGTLSFGTSLFWPTPADRISVQTRHFVVWHFLILTYSCRSHLCANTALCRLALPYSDLLLPIAFLCKHGTSSFGTSLFWPTPADRISVQTRHFIIWHFLILTYSCRSHLCANTAPHCLALHCSDLLPPLWDSTTDSWVVLQYWWSSFCLMEKNKNC